MSATPSSSPSSPAPVWNGVPHGSAVVPVLFSIFINDLDKGFECSLREFTASIMLGRGVDLGSRRVLQRDLGRLDPWVKVTCVSFNKAKCQVLHLGYNNPVQCYKFGESVSAEKDLRVLVDKREPTRAQMEVLNKQLCAKG